MPKQVTVVLARMIRQTHAIVVEVPDDFPVPTEPAPGGTPEHDELLRLTWDHRQDDNVDGDWEIDQDWGVDEGTHMLLPPPAKRTRNRPRPEFRLTGSSPAHYSMTTIRREW